MRRTSLSARMHGGAVIASVAAVLAKTKSSSAKHVQAAYNDLSVELVMGICGPVSNSK
jgi:hypothetical protein